MFSNRLIQALFGLLLISTVCSKAPKDSTPFSSYTLEKIVPNEDQSVFTGTLVYSGTENYYVNTTNPIIKKLSLKVIYVTEDHVQIKISDADSKRWELPEESPYPFKNAHSKHYENSVVTMSFDLHPKPFALTITRKTSEEVIFTTKDKDFIFSNNYIEFSTSLPTQNIYGFGERTHKLNLGPGTYSLWNADSRDYFDDGTEGHSSHGFHPVYLMQEKKEKCWSMVLLRNVNAMSVEVSNYKTLTYRVSGGMIDLNFFIGNPLEYQPEGVVTDYHEYLGGWAMPPLWAFGYHQSKSDYNNLTKLTEVILNAKKNDLPLDAIWSDVSYLKDLEDFTLDTERFSPSEFKNLLNHHKKKWVPAINDAVAKNSSFFTDKKVLGIFKRNPNDDIYVGKDGEREAVCVDFFSSMTLSAWRSGLNVLKQSVPFSGLWLKTNEVTTENDDTQGILNNLPYSPTGGKLTKSSISLDAKNYLDIEFNTHNVQNLLESSKTYEYLKTENSLPFIMAKSSVFGSGKYAGHIIDETGSYWKFLKSSVASISSFNIYGIPMTGSDICGNHYHATEELCARWMQLGALYPFARNHAHNESVSQEPWALGSTLLETSRIALNVRYSLIKYYYSLFLQKFSTDLAKESQSGSGTIFRPIFFFELDDDLHEIEKTLFESNDVTETQFLLGSGLLVAPVVEEDTTSRNVYFPQDNWFNFFTGEKVIDKNATSRTLNVKAPLNSTIPMFLRDGTIVFTQDTRGVLSTGNLDNVYKLVAGLSLDAVGKLTAKGNIIGLNKFTEANIRQNCMAQSCLILSEVALETDDKFINFTVEFNKGNYAEDVKISGLKLYGAAANTTSIDFLTMNKEETAFDGVTVVRLNNGTLDIKFLTPRVVSFPAEEGLVKWTISIPAPKPKAKIVPETRLLRVNSIKA